MKIIRAIKRYNRFIKRNPIAQRNKVRVYMRILSWQITSALRKKPIEVPFISGLKLVLEKGMTGATGNYYGGLHEFNEMGLVLHLVNDGDLFIDAGSNVGVYSLLASGVKGAKSLSFEPALNTFERLLRNVRVNHLQDKVICHNMALGVGNALNIQVPNSNPNNTFKCNKCGNCNHMF